ncbi:MAG: TetR/AcrR family transcriptional regulator [Lachnospiraceae bacterium]|nr:TetR/AcrR family transcriptional regulator [Lachnospiraceae bacterium]MBP5184107.1 TetR/AcrR family transcriptional regulator [Lachnospiraceae bacterium]
MPKIIDNARKELIRQTRETVAKEGYTLFSMRNVAKQCGIAPGTIYNYFHSKDDLIMACMQEDWDNTIEGIKALQEKKKLSAIQLFEKVYSGISDFCKANESIIKDPEAGINYFKHFSHYHSQLVNDIHEIIEPTVKQSAVSYTAFLSDFIAENILKWSVRGTSFSELKSILKTLFK